MFSFFSSIGMLLGLLASTFLVISLKIYEVEEILGILTLGTLIAGFKPVPRQCYETTSLIPFTPKIPQRTYPDIAFVSAGGYNIPEFGFGTPLIYQGQLYLWYGTSGAAPMTAAMVSLAGVRPELLNSILYHISYCGEIFTPKGCIKGLPAWIPITTGANPTLAHYGWNYVTGPGTYDAYAMVKDFLIY